MEIIKNIAAVIGCILSATSLIALCTKGGRNFIKAFFQKNAKDLYEENKRQSADIEKIKNILDILLKKTDAQDEVLKQNCRNTLKDIYYKYQRDKRIPLYERKTADHVYKIYNETFNGNSYAALLYSEICKWEIDTISFQDLNED